MLWAHSVHHLGTFWVYSEITQRKLRDHLENTQTSIRDHSEVTTQSAPTSLEVLLSVLPRYYWKHVR